MTDRQANIVERLREPVMLRYNAEQINAERREAADEIERLRAEIERLQTANGTLETALMECEGRRP